MRRALAPAAACPPAYPGLRAAWRILAGAAPLLCGQASALADASVPSPLDHGNQIGPSPNQAAVKPPCRIDLAGKQKAPRVPPPPAPAPAPIQPKPKTPPPMRGEMMRVTAPHAMLLHPHAPGEPCFTVGSDEELA